MATYTYKGSFETRIARRRIILKDVSRMMCRKCKEEFFTVRQVKALERQCEQYYKKMDPVVQKVQPEAIRQFRNETKISQQELELALGLGQKMLVKYETGKSLPSPTVSRLLLLAMRDKETLKFLRKNALRAV